jgi:hypothetical protein
MESETREHQFEKAQVRAAVCLVPSIWIDEAEIRSDVTIVTDAAAA